MSAAAVSVDTVRVCQRCGETRYPWEFADAADHCDHCSRQDKWQAREAYDRERSRERCREWKEAQCAAEQETRTRICTHCSAEKPLDQYSWTTKRGVRYRRGYCNECKRAMQRALDRRRNVRPDRPKSRSLRGWEILRDARKGGGAQPEPRRLPATRADCRCGPRPCPYVSCRHNLYLDVSPRSGAIKLHFPNIEPWEMEPGASCALDIADRGRVTLEGVGGLLNVTRERARQLEVKALAKLEADPRVKVILEGWVRK